MNEKFIQFLLQKTHLQRDEIKPEIRLAQDIGYYGLDAISFMDDFFSEFEISNMEQYDEDAHIDGGPDFAPNFIKKLKTVFIKKHKKYQNPDITLGHLNKVVEQKRWFNER